MKAKRNLSLSTESDAVLSRVGNASEYLSKVIRFRSAAWRHALSALRSEGMSNADILRAATTEQPRDGSARAHYLGTLAEELALGNDDLRRRLGEYES